MHSSLMMVRQVVEYGEGTVELLGEDDTYHLVREGHLRKGNLALGKGVHLGRETVGASDDKDKTTAHGVHSLLEPLGEAYGGELLAALVEQDDVVARLDELDNLLTFALLLLLLREVLHIADIGNYLQLDRGIVAGAGKVVVDRLREVAVIGFTNGYKEGLHLV